MENFDFEKAFNSKSIISVDKSDYEFVMKGKDATIITIEIKNEEKYEKYINEAFAKATGNYKDNNNAILYIKANKTITLYFQAQVLEAIRKQFNNELNIIYGVDIDDKLDNTILVYVISSKI